MCRIFCLGPHLSPFLLSHCGSSSVVLLISESFLPALILYRFLRYSLQHLFCLLQTPFMSLTLNRSFALLSSLFGVCRADQGESVPFVSPRLFGIPLFLPC